MRLEQNIIKVNFFPIKYILILYINIYAHPILQLGFFRLPWWFSKNPLANAGDLRVGAAQQEKPLQEKPTHRN